MSQRPRLSDADIERMIIMRESGKSYEQIGRALGMSAKAISWHCLKHGADPPKPAPTREAPDQPVEIKRGNHVIRLYTKDDDRRLVEMEASGASMAEMARALGRKGSSIKGRLMTLARHEERALCLATPDQPIARLA